MMVCKCASVAPWLMIAAIVGATNVCHGRNSQGQNLIGGDSSFETGYGVWDKTGAIDSTTAIDGSRSIQAKQAIHTWERFALTRGQAYTFSIYLKANQPATEIRLLARRADWGTDSPTKVVTVGTEWARYSLIIPADRDGSWSDVWLWVNRPESSAQPDRTFWADACQLEQAELASPYASAEAISVVCQVDSPVEGHVFFPDEEVAITIKLYNSQAQDASVRVSYEVQDYYTETVAADTIPMHMAAKGNARHRIDLGCPTKKGFYVVRYGLAGAPDAAARTSTFCVVARPLAYDPEVGSLFGVCHIPGDRVPAVARMGTRWTTVTFMWPWLERTQGSFDEGYLAGRIEKLDLMARHGINVIGHPHRTPDWAAEYADHIGSALPSPAGVAAYEEYVYRVVNRFKDRISWWMCWGGEDDLKAKHHAARMGRSEEWVTRRLAEVMKAGYRGARRADPTCFFGGVGRVSGMDCERHYPFSRKLLELAGDHANSFCIDPYTWPRTYGEGLRVVTPEEHGFTDVLEEGLAVAGDRKFWIAEYGVSLSDKEAMDSPSAKAVGDFLVRSHILAATVPRVELLQWYSVGPSWELGGSYDMWRWPNPLPAVAARAALAQVLTGARNPRQIEMGMIRAHCFAKTRGSLAALWVPADKEVSIQLAQAEGIRVLDIMGNELPDPAGAIELAGSPVYLVSDMSQEALEEVVSRTRIDLPPVNVELQLVDLTHLRAHLTHQVTQTLSGTVAVTLPLVGLGPTPVTGSFAGLEVGSTAVVEMELPADIDIAQLTECVAVGEVQTNLGEVEVSQDLSVTACQRMDRPIAIDGNLEEWAGREGIAIEDASYLSPPDAWVHRLWTGDKDLSLRACVGWDDERFYFAAEVADDIFANDSEKKSIWGGDSIQLGFDMSNDALATKPPRYEDDDVELCLGYSERIEAAVVYRSWPVAGAESKAQVAVRREGTRTYYELAVPFEELSSLQAVAGKVFGFNFVALDRDEGAGVDYWLGLTPGIAGGKDPRAFDRFILADAPVAAEGIRSRN